MASKKETVKETKQEERVSIFIPHPTDSTGETETVVGVNGKLYQIQYDKPVRVPKEVAEVVMRSKNLKAKIDDLRSSAKLSKGKAAFADI